MRLGIHASVRKGFPAALHEAAELGCRSVQIFPRRPGAPFVPLTGEMVGSVREIRDRFSIHPLIVHSVLQPNIASTRPLVYRRSQDSLAEELRYSAELGAEFLVIHSGNYSEDS